MVFSRDNLPRIKDGACIISHNHKQSKINHWVSSFTDRNTAVYFDSFETEYIPQKVIKKLKGNLSRTTYLEYKTMILLCVDFIVLLS